MVSFLSLERAQSASEQETGVAASLLQLADAYGLYSGVYIHFGHGRGSARHAPLRAIASSPVARRLYVDLLVGSSVVAKAHGGHRPFSWLSEEAHFAQSPEQPHAGIAVPVQDHVNGPGLVALIGLDFDKVRTAVSEDGPALSWTATGIHMDALQALRTGQSATPTPREMECLRLSAEGCTAAVIGAQLCIAVRTVEFHLRNVVEKLGATSKVNAVAIAASRGLLRCDPMPALMDKAG